MKNHILNFKLLLIIVLLGSLTLGLNAQNKGKEKNKEGKALSFDRFQNTDIGAKTQPGSASATKEGLQITAGGSDVWGTHDEFHYCYLPVKGDFEFTVRVVSLGKAHQYTKAGIMARADLDDNSQHIFYQLFPDNSARNKNNGGCEFQYREVKGGGMKAIYPDPATAGHQFDVNYPNTWIRLVRKGDLFEGYISNDNKTWTLYASYSLHLPEELKVGLAVTSHNAKATTTAEFGAVRLK